MDFQHYIDQTVAWAQTNINTRPWATALLGAASVFVGYRLYVSAKRPISTRGRVVLVTGASSGIGRALAEELYKAGARVLLASRQLEKLRALQTELESRYPATGGEIRAVQLDLAALDELEHKSQELWNAYGSIDSVIHNAGIGHRGSAVYTTRAVWEQVMQTNFFGPVVLNTFLIPRMLVAMPSDTSSSSPSTTKQVVLISSVQGKVSLPNRAAYAASKFALQAYSESLRAELTNLDASGSSANVLLISPGFVATDLSSNAIRGDGQVNAQVDAANAEGYTSHYMAREIVKAMEKAQDDVVISQPIGHLAIWLRFFCPSLLNSLMASRAKRELETGAVKR